MVRKPLRNCAGCFLILLCIPMSFGCREDEKDRIPPETWIVSSPPDLSTSSHAVFEFDCSEDACSFECQVNSGGWSACSSPREYTGMPDGTHTFEVRAIDIEGNIDESPVAYAWTIETPEVILPAPVFTNAVFSPGLGVIDLAWSGVEGAAEYRVYYDTDSSGPPYLGAGAAQGPSPITTSEVSLSLTSLDGSRSYYLALTAVDGNGVESEYSGEILRAEESCDGLDNDGDSYFDELGCGATGSFSLVSEYTAGSEPQGIAAGDFNADGILDLAVVNTGEDSVGISLGNGEDGRGDGTFAAAQGYATGNRPVGIATGDFNSDRITDLALTNRMDGSVSILLGGGSNGRGLGTFSSAGEYAVGYDPSGIVAGDFNSDGIEDLAAANEGSNTISVLIGNGGGGRGDGTFAAALNYPVGRLPFGMGIGDFNSDGIQDLAVTNQVDNTVSILLGNGSGGQGDGTFASAADYDVWSSGAGSMAYPRGICVGDFNSDLIPDLAVTISWDSYVSILLGGGDSGRGDGTFLLAGEYEVGTWPHGVAAGDFNSDGISDLTVVNNLNDSISILPGNGGGGRGDGTFAPAVTCPVGDGPYHLAVGDFSSDGIKDLAVTNGRDDTFSVLIGEGTQGMPDGTYSVDRYVAGAYGPWGIAAGDFNSDGIQDFAVANADRNDVGIFLGNGSQGKGDGSFTLSGDYDTGEFPAGVGPHGLVVGDFNSDGIADLAVTNHESEGEGDVGILLGDGTDGRGYGRFRPEGNYPVGQMPEGIAAGDFNSDGISDLAVANTQSGSITVLIGSGSGGRGDGGFIQPATSYSAGVGAEHIAVGDFNSDGIQDLAVANRGANTVSVLLGSGSGGRGNGSFSSGVDYSVEQNPLKVAVADFDTDGIQDLAVLNYWSSTVSILLGDGSGGRGNGAFIPSGNYPAGAWPCDVIVEDVNRDGIQDLIAANSLSDDVSILLGNGEDGLGFGTFATAVDYQVKDEPKGLIAGDFNSDGILDIAVTGYGEHTVSILRGLGDFQTP